MKKNTLHKVMATALVGAMAMSTLTGCGSSADNTTADAGTKESVAESSAASTDAGASTAVVLTVLFLGFQNPFHIQVILSLIGFIKCISQLFVIFLAGSGINRKDNRDFHHTGFFCHIVFAFCLPTAR